MLLLRVVFVVAGAAIEDAVDRKATTCALARLCHGGPVFSRERPRPPFASERAGAFDPGGRCRAARKPGGQAATALCGFLRLRLVRRLRRLRAGCLLKSVESACERRRIKSRFLQNFEGGVVGRSFLLTGVTQLRQLPADQPRVLSES